MLIHNNFRSWCLQTNVDVDIIIPDINKNENPAVYYNHDRRFPVLWLLHGTWGGYNDFVRRTNIDLYAKECGIMVVMPNAMNSEYSNWPTFMLGYNQFDFLIKELMPMIHGFFPASSKKEDNYIAGISMGSIGAIKYAVNYPELFAGCGCLSGTPVDVRTLYQNEKCQERTLNLIKNSGGIEAFLNSYENVWDKCKVVAKNDDSPLFYVSCGTEDFLYQNYQDFKEYAEEIQLNAVFSETPGYGHEWRFWELEIQNMLKVFKLDQGKRNVTLSSDFSGKLNKSLL